MWTDKCHKCGRNIFNGIPQGEDSVAYIAKKREEGFEIGQNSRMIGTYGHNFKDVPCKPICNICQREESETKNKKETKKAMRKLSKIIKKEFSCPICEYSQRNGYNTKVFKTTNKAEMMKHISDKHNLSEIKDVLPTEKDY